MLNYICKPSLLSWSDKIKQLIFCTIPETTMSRYFMPWTAAYVRFPSSLFNVKSISSWSLDWTSRCVASRCVAKHKSVEAASKPAIKKSTTCATKSSSSHSVLRTKDSNSDKHVGYEKHMYWRHEEMWSILVWMNGSCGSWEWGRCEKNMKIKCIEFT